MNHARFGRLALVCLLMSSAAWAQSGAIAGIVQDAQGAAVANVTVEASSPALIEGSRRVTTNDEGLYKIVDLRPGTYTVTFSMTGFSTVKREGIELTTSFTATVNAALNPGAVSETVTVSAEAPVLDVQNTVVQKVISNEVLTSLPVGKSAALYTTLIPGAIGTATNQDVGGSKGENAQGFRIHGTLANDFIQLREGMFFGTLIAAGNFMTSTNPASIEEVVVETSGFTAESQTNGGHVNIVQRDGGNAFHGQARYDVTSSSLQSSNLTDSLRNRGLNSASSIRKQYDVGGGFGGPIIKNKLWYFASARYWITSAFQPGNYYNKTQGTLFYTPDLERPAYELNYYKEASARLTWQASPRNKFSASYSFQRNCNCFFGIAAGNIAPEAAGNNLYRPDNNFQATWTFPATSRLLLWAGITLVKGQVNRQFSGGSASDISVIDLANNYRYGAAGSSLLGLPNSWGSQEFTNVNENIAATYVTGAHSLKFGFGMLQAPGGKVSDINNSVSYTFRNKIPQSITYWATPFSYRTRLDLMNLFVSDQWRIRRFTITAGLRYDGLRGNVPEQHLAAGLWVPKRDFAAVSNTPNWKDLNPRFGFSYDVFGNGKTAIKASLSRAVNFEASGGYTLLNNPVNAMVTSATRNWNDANSDYIPQESELGPISNSAFGTVVRNTFYSDDVVKGWGNRGYSWAGSVSLQHELRPGLALNVGYFRTWFGNFTVTDNTLVTSADYDPYCITSPTDARLPDGGGKQICGFADIQKAKFGLVNNLVVPASKFGKQSDVFTGIDVTLNARFRKGVFSGGMSTGHEVTDRCFVVDSPQELYQCRIDPPWYSTTQFKFLGVYPLPWKFQVSGNVQILPSIPFLSNYVLTSAQVKPSLGRDLSAGTTSTVALDLIPNNTEFREGWNTQVDFRLSRNFQIGERWKLQPTLDLFNALNASSVLSANSRYGTSWQNALVVLGGRVIKFGVQVNF